MEKRALWIPAIIIALLILVILLEPVLNLSPQIGKLTRESDIQKTGIGVEAFSTEQAALNSILSKGQKEQAINSRDISALKKAIQTNPSAVENAIQQYKESSAGQQAAQESTASCQDVDFDSDGNVGFSDLTEILVNWGACTGNCVWDVDNNGDIGFNDLAQLLINWGPCTPEPVCHTGTASWQNFPLTAQTGTFTAEFDATPLVSGVDGVTAMSFGAQNSYSTFSMLIRFAEPGQGGKIDVRNGNIGYACDTCISYVIGQGYHFRVEADLVNRKYDVFVTPESTGVEVQIADNYDFRPQSPVVTQINNWGMISLPGSHEVCDFNIVLPVCGNGNVEGTEACDDDNLENLDGCSSACAVEPGWICDSNEPSNCEQITECNNNVNDDIDGWTDEADPGCWTNPTNPLTYVSSDDNEFNTNTATGFQCSDNGDNDADGLIDGNDSHCANWQDPTEEGTIPGNNCGNGELEPDYGETCDDGANTPEDGCSSTCQIEGQGSPIYATQTGSGSQTGADWTNARAGLPTSLQRGKLYYIADGIYPFLNLNNAPAGNAYIIVKKATIADHGTSTGWNDNMGDGVAGFPRATVTNYHNLIVDGNIQGGFLFWRGIPIGNDYDAPIWRIETSENITLRNSDLDGGLGAACKGVWEYYSSYLTFYGNDINGVLDDGFELFGGDHIYLYNNEIHNLLGIGSNTFPPDTPFGQCFNGHSDGIETLAQVEHSVYKRNFIHDIDGGGGSQGTSAFITDGDTNLTLENNVFYTPEVTFVVYLDSVDDAKVYNNIFWGGTSPLDYGSGIAFGPNPGPTKIYNNILYSIDLDHMGGFWNPVIHKADYNIYLTISDIPLGANDINLPDNQQIFANIPNFGVVNDVDIEDFFYRSDSPAIDSAHSGNATLQIPDLDILMQERFDISGTPNDGAGDYGNYYDIGALEFTT